MPLRRLPAVQLVSAPGIRRRHSRHWWAWRGTDEKPRQSHSLWANHVKRVSGTAGRLQLAVDGVGKRALYRDLFDRLVVGGALLLADVVASAGEWERRLMARSCGAVARRQSLVMIGSLDAYARFLTTKWNLFEHQDPMGMPSTVAEHLTWLAEAGFSNVSVFRLHAGHADYGGYRSPAG